MSERERLARARLAYLEACEDVVAVLNRSQPLREDVEIGAPYPDTGDFDRTPLIEALTVAWSVGERWTDVRCDLSLSDDEIEAIEADPLRAAALLREDEGEPVPLAVCEAGQILLRPNTTYRTYAQPGCHACEAIAQSYARPTKETSDGH